MTSLLRLGRAVAGCLLFAAPAFAAPTVAAPDPWAMVPQILARIVPPTFPDRTFDITRFGAKPDGTNDCTQAFQDAIAACHDAGGGKVLVPAGTFLTGAIHLRDNVDLHLAKDATIRFSTDPGKFLPVVFTRDIGELMNYSPFIYALGQTNIAITGEGTLDGQASKSVWPDWVKKSGPDGDALNRMGEQELPVRWRVFGEGHFIRPHFIQPVRCRNLLIQGVTILDSPNWVITPLYCTNVTVQGVHVRSHGKNNDGCDPDSSTDVLIKGCTFDTGDDCIAIKAGRDHDGRRINIPSQNIVIQDCVFKDGHGGVTIGSETAGGIRNVFAENCEFDSPDLDQAMRFKTNPARGGFIENANIRNCRVKTARFGIFITMKYGGSGLKDGDAIPTVSGIDIRDCTFEKLTKQPLVIEGWSAAAKVTGITVTNCTFENAAGPGTITNAARIHLTGNRGLNLESID